MIFFSKSKEARRKWGKLLFGSKLRDLEEQGNGPTLKQDDDDDDDNNVENDFVVDDKLSEVEIQLTIGSSVSGITVNNSIISTNVGVTEKRSSHVELSNRLSNFGVEEVAD